MSNLTVQLNGAAIQAINTGDSSYRVNSLLSNIVLSANEVTYSSYFPVMTGGGTVLVLPAATIWALYVKNQSGTGINIQVLNQVTGGSLLTAANSRLLVPGGIDLYWQTSEGAGGIIAVTLIASASSGVAEILMAS